MTALPPAFLARPIAHRGYHDAATGRIENSRSAFAAAMDAGYGIELDVQLSRDGVAMVFHDTVLDRLTDETGPVRDRDAAALQDIALTGSRDTIQTLTQVLRAIDGTVPVLVEIKDQSGVMGDSDGQLEQATADALTGYAGPLAMMSFNPDMVNRFGRMAPTIPRGLVGSAWRQTEESHVPVDTRARLAAIADFDTVGASFLSFEKTDLDLPFVQRLKLRGVPILCWTVRSREQENAARALADNITFEGYAA